MKKRIAVLTTNRSEYGLLRSVIVKLQECKRFKTDVLVSGTHLESKWGNTVQEIENDGIQNLQLLKIYSPDNESHISKVMAEAIITFDNLFRSEKYTMLVVLGDRYETFAVCIAALNFKIPIAHIHGGEISEGALDNYYRNCITKMSYLHFTSLPEYRNRVIQLGESPERVFCVGALGVENIKHMRLLERNELEQSLDFKLDKPYAVVTYHPVSIKAENEIDDIKELLLALDEEEDLKYIITYSNSDEGGSEINNTLEEYVVGKKNVLLVKSLGNIRYLSALKYATMVIGNSSSGIIEAPSFHIPTINIGNRQKGRQHSETVIDCNMKSKDIVTAIIKGKKMLKKCDMTNISNPYEQSNTSEMIVKTICDNIGNDIDLRKQFYDIKIGR